MTPPESRARRRGVRASRIKLSRALTEAGLKTQAALAERMADLEGLDAPPKDVVNRVFREQAVDPITLERVARALGTESYKLYLTADDVGGVADEGPSEEAPSGEPALDSAPAVSYSEAPAREPRSTPPHAGRQRRFMTWASVAAALVVLLIAGVLLWSQWRPGGLPYPPGAHESVLKPRFGRFKVALTQFTGDEGGELGVLVQDRLALTVGVASPALSVISDANDRGQIAERFRVDAVIDGEIVQVSQLMGIRVFAYVHSLGRREQIWSETFPVTARERKLAGAADRIAASVNRLFGLPAADSRNPPHFPLAPVQDEYLQGRSYLDKAPSEINLRRASGYFESALRHDANYAAAHAGVCEVTLDAVWINEERQLADAEKACGRAMQLAPQAPEVLRAHAYFLQRSGRAAEAVEILRRLTATDADDMEVMLALANAEFEQQRRTGDPRWSEASLRHAREATQVAPDFWKPWMWLGIFASAIGELDESIRALETAHALDDQNEYVVTNLGTMLFCRGDLDAARDLYLKARDVAPGSYAGTEFLGLVYYYLRDFAESARLRQKALDMARAAGDAEIHQMWGALADSYRQVGVLDKAIAAYVRALEIVERDFIMGNATIADKAARAYYYLTLLQLNPRDPPKAAVAASLERDLDEALESTAEGSALLRVTQAWLIKNDLGKARAALKKATERCRCYEKFPDIERLVARSRPSTQARTLE